MISSKFFASITVWMLLSLSAAYSQTPDIAAPLPKWEFGLRGGAGFSSIQLDRRQSPIIISGGPIRGYNDLTRHGELYIGSYATRHLGRHWSVRSELSLISQTYVSMAASLGVFPRYRLTNWLILETGIEGRLPIGGLERAETKFSIGTAFNLKQLELNLRFSPGYQPSSPFNRGGWFGSFQAGASIKLATIGNLLGKN